MSTKEEEIMASLKELAIWFTQRGKYSVASRINLASDEIATDFRIRSFRIAAESDQPQPGGNDE